MRWLVPRFAKINQNLQNFQKVLLTAEFDIFQPQTMEAKPETLENDTEDNQWVDDWFQEVQNQPDSLHLRWRL